MTTEGVDYSWGRPGAAALVAAGKRFACRYLPYQYGTVTDNGKGLTAAEISDLRSHGLSIVLNFEWYKARMKEGYAAGVADAKQSAAAIARLGIPDTVAVYFSADWDTSLVDYPAIDAYLRGAASVLTLNRVGVYGEAALIAHCRKAGVARWFWQTYAWSGGVLSPYAHIYQYHNGQQINGEWVDLDRAYADLYGQWSPPLPDSSTAGASDVAITGGGLTRTSDYTLALKAGQALYNDSALTDVRTKLSADATVEYFGSAGSAFAVEVVTASGFSDGLARPVIVYVPTTVGKPAPKPPVVDDTQAKIDAAVQAALDSVPDAVPVTVTISSDGKVLNSVAASIPVPKTA